MQADDAPGSRRIVVTGAGGFVGLRVAQTLHRGGDHVIGIGRGMAPAGWPEAARWIQADLADAAAYERALTGASCVVHLAAITGKARAAAYMRGNVDATQILLDACQRANTRRFVFVSSIAAKFTDRRFYPYAESKIAAEARVRAAPIIAVIVRPTIILGSGSPIEEALGKLACLPISPMFGDGRRRVQPIDIEDVVEALVQLARASEVGDQLVELGGAEAYDLRELYARLRAAHGVQGAPRLVHLPLGPARWGLALLEKPLLPLLPLTAGQLATFANDGLATRSASVEQVLPNPRPAPRPADVTVASPTQRDLTAEFTRHARYLAGTAPTVYQTEKYLEFHAQRTLALRDRFDTLLLSFSRAGPVGLALADSYSGLLCRKSVIRAKLVLALAILEASPPSFAALDRPDPGGRLAYLHLAARGAMAGLSVVLAALLLAPPHFVLALAGRSKPSS